MRSALSPGRRAAALAAYLLLLVVALSGLFVLVARAHTPGQYPLLEVHRWAGFALLALAVPGLVLHIKATRSRTRNTVLGVALALLATIPALSAMEKPAGTSLFRRQLLFRGSDVGEPFTLADVPTCLLAFAPGAAAKGHPVCFQVGSTAALTVLLVGAGLLAVLGLLGRSRERNASRWSGVAVTMLSVWALTTGLIVTVAAREHWLFGGMTQHSLAGTGAAALLLLHVVHARIADRRYPRVPTALLGALFLAGTAAVWIRGYSAEHFSGAASAGAGPSYLAPPDTAEEVAAYKAGRGPRPGPHATSLADSARCAASGCHPQITREWAGSPHRFSASNAFYRATVRDLVAETGPESALFCARCHDPARLLAGTLLDDYAEGVPEGGSDGVSCVVCHATVASRREPPGNGDFVVALPRDPPGDGARERRHLRLDPRPHRAAFVHPDMLIDRRGCEVCHRLELAPEGAGRTFLLQHQELLPERNPGGPAPCTACHLPLGEDGRYTHRMAGINADLSRYATGVDAQDLELIAEHEAAAQERSGMHRALPIGSDDLGSREDWEPAIALSLQGALGEDGSLRLNLRTENHRIGHRFPSGPFDLQEVWLEVWVRDATRRVVAHQGRLGPLGGVLGDPLRLGARELDAAGEPIRRHRLYTLAAVEDKRQVGAGPRRDRVVLPLGPEVALPLEVRARWLFRRARPRFTAWALDQPGARLPAWELALAETTVP